MVASSNKFASSAAKTLSEFKGTAINGSIGALTIILEEILNRTVYYCPCVESEELKCYSTSSSINSSYVCTPSINRSYGFAYMVSPAIALFFLMAASSPRLWKTFTGCIKKDRETKRRKEMMLWTVTEVFSRSLIAPLTWVCFALLDGRYWACALTPLPYDVGPSASYASCTLVAKELKPKFSDAYMDNKSFSQIIGWFTIAIVIFLGFFIYLMSRCVFPLTYYHAKYYTLYQNYEEEEFDDEMKTKAQKTAESNIRKFMAKDREKALWDRISTVFSFHRNPKNIALYSYLHEFILEDEKNRPLLSIDNTVAEVGVEADAEDTL